MLPPVITPPEIDPEVVRELVRDIEAYLASIAAEGGAAGATGTVVAASVPWFPEVVLGLSVVGAVLGVVKGDPQLAALAGPIGSALAELVGPQPSIGQVLVAKLGAARLAAIAVLPKVGGATGLGAEVMPSPSAVNELQPSPLAHAVAPLAVWQRAHHNLVHGGLVDAQGRADAAMPALAAATASSLADAVRAIDAIVTNFLPEAVHQLDTNIKQLKVAQQAANNEQTHALLQAQKDLVHRIGDVVHWLVTEPLPELERELKIEAEARTKAVAQLTRGIGTEVDDRTGADTQLAAAVAPLLAWAGGFGVHTTEKVKRNEDAIDRLGSLDLSSLLAFASVPALTALLTKLAPRFIGYAPDALAALEHTAAAVLGNV